MAKSGSLKLPLFSLVAPTRVLARTAGLRQSLRRRQLWDFEMNYVLVFIGGGLGSVLRHTVNVICPRLFGTNFPYHTFIINITGSTVMGLIAGYLAFKGDA